jgi:hypothetical protein
VKTIYKILAGLFLLLVGGLYTWSIDSTDIKDSYDAIGALWFVKNASSGEPVEVQSSSNGALRMELVNNPTITLFTINATAFLINISNLNTSVGKKADRIELTGILTGYALDLDVEHNYTNLLTNISSLNTTLGRKADRGEIISLATLHNNSIMRTWNMSIYALDSDVNNNRTNLLINITALNKSTGLKAYRSEILSIAALNNASIIRTWNLTNILGAYALDLNVNQNRTNLRANDTQLWLNISAMNKSLGKKLESATASDVNGSDINVTGIRLNNTMLRDWRNLNPDVVVCRNNSGYDLEGCDVVCYDGDCSDEINNAILNGLKVKLQCGDYQTNSQIILKNNSYLVGSGHCTNIILNNTDTSIEAAIGTNKKYIHSAGISDLAIWTTSNSVDNPNCGFNLACSDCFVQNVNTNYNNFVTSRENKVSTNVFIENLHVYSGLSFNGTNMTIVLGGKDGIINLVGKNIKINNLYADSYTPSFSGGIVLNPSTSGCYNSSNIQIDGLYVNGCYGSLIHSYSHSCGEIIPIPQYSIKNVVYNQKFKGNYEHFAVFPFLPSATKGDYDMLDWGIYNFENVAVKLINDTALFNLQLTNYSLNRRLIVNAKNFNVDGVDVLFWYPNAQFTLKDSTIKFWNGTTNYIARFGSGQADSTHKLILEDVTLIPSEKVAGIIRIDATLNNQTNIPYISFTKLKLQNGNLTISNTGTKVLPIRAIESSLMFKSSGQEELIDVYTDLTNTNIKRTGYITPLLEGIPEENIIGLFNADNNTLDWSSTATNVSPKRASNISYTKGVFGSAYNFSGRQSQIVIQHDSKQNVSHLGKWSACAWINPQDIGSNMAILRKESNYLLYIHSSGGLWVRVWNLTGSAKERVEGVIPTNQWTFVCGTSNGTYIIPYINAQEYIGLSYKKGIGSSSNNINIGSNGNADKFNGSIDQVMIFNIALSNDQIDSLYEQTKPIQPYGGYYSRNKALILPQINMFDVGTLIYRWNTIWARGINVSNDINATSFYGSGFYIRGSNLNTNITNLNKSLGKKLESASLGVYLKNHTYANLTNMTLGIKGCSVDTDSTGKLICGTDATGSFTNGSDINVRYLNVTNRLFIGALKGKINLTSNGDVNATKFYGDGSGLTGITVTGAYKYANFSLDYTRYGGYKFANFSLDYTRYGGWKIANMSSYALDSDVNFNYTNLNNKIKSKIANGTNANLVKLNITSRLRVGTTIAKVNLSINGDVNATSFYGAGFYLRYSNINTNLSKFNISIGKKADRVDLAQYALDSDVNFNYTNLNNKIKSKIANGTNAYLVNLNVSNRIHLGNAIRRVNISASGDVNATKFYGNGAGITGITSTDGTKIKNNTNANLVYVNITNRLRTTGAIVKVNITTNGDINATKFWGTGFFVRSTNLNTNISNLNNMVIGTRTGILNNATAVRGNINTNRTKIEASILLNRTKLNLDINNNRTNLRVNDTQLRLNISNLNKSLGKKLEAASLGPYLKNGSAANFSKITSGTGRSVTTYNLQIGDVNKAVNLSDVLYVNGSSNRVGIGVRNPSVKSILNVMGTGDGTNNLIGINSTVISTTAGDIFGIRTLGQSNDVGASAYGGHFTAKDPSAATATTYGVYATATGGIANWAGYFDGGNVFINNRLGIGTATPSSVQKVNIIGGMNLTGNITISPSTGGTNARKAGWIRNNGTHLIIGS